MITDSLIQAKNSYFWGVTSLLGCEEDGGNRHFFQSSAIYLAEDNSICFWEIHKREILNLVIWLGLEGRDWYSSDWIAYVY